MIRGIPRLRGDMMQTRREFRRPRILHAGGMLVTQRYFLFCPPITLNDLLSNRCDLIQSQRCGGRERRGAAMRPASARASERVLS